MTDEEKKVVASAISTLVLADHMGDASQATDELVGLLFGAEGMEALEGYCESHKDRRLPRLLAQYEPAVWADEAEDEVGDD